MFADLESDMVLRLSLLRECIYELNELKLVTLGPEGTSSEAAGRYLLGQVDVHHKELELFPNYERAAQKVINAEADLLLVANAYKGIDVFYMAPSLYFICAFFYQTPVYGIAARKGWRHDPEKHYTITTHHAPVSLASWFLQDMKLQYQMVLADSTATAARAVRSGEVELCITNSVAAQTYGLEFVTRTRPIRMLWSVFQRKRNDGQTGIALPTMGF